MAQMNQDFEWHYEACPKCFETLAFYPEHVDIDKQNLAWIIINPL